MRPACQHEVFFSRMNDKYYCVLHYPGEKKSLGDAGAFNSSLKNKLDAKDFHFEGVFFPKGSIGFSGVEFSGEANFRGAIFSAEIDFSKAIFNAEADFSGARFSAGTNFEEVRFNVSAKFEGTSFDSWADFSQASFSWANFSQTSFREVATFNKATFNGFTDFEKSGFSAWGNFAGSSFGDLSNFSRANFSGIADFDKASFSSTAIFDGASFSAEAIFGSVKFSKTATFSSAKFGALAYFCSAIFSAEAIFVEASFNAEARFWKASFSALAYFDSAKFGAEASFSRASFTAKTTFSRASFTAEADFTEVSFDAEADFTGANFNAEADFGQASFDMEGLFNDATFKDFTYFAGLLSERPIGNNTRLDFQFAHFDKPDRVLFHTLDLRPHWFVNVDSRKFEFIDVKFNYKLKNEIESLRNAKVEAPYSLLERACRQLADNAEANHRYREASRLRYSSFEARRIEKIWGFVPWRLDFWYWLASGYGESVRRAFIVFITMIFFFAFWYTRVGFEQTAKAIDTGMAQISASPAPWDLKGKPLGGLDAKIYSAYISILQKPDPKPLTPAAKALVWMETVLGPVQAALLALAIRRRFMR